MYSKLLCMFLYIVGLERRGEVAVALGCLFGGASASREKIVIGGVLLDYSHFLVAFVLRL